MCHNSDYAKRSDSSVAKYMLSGAQMAKTYTLRLRQRPETNKWKNKLKRQGQDTSRTLPVCHVSSVQLTSGGPHAYATSPEVSPASTPIPSYTPLPPSFLPSLSLSRNLTVSANFLGLSLTFPSKISLPNQALDIPVFSFSVGLLR